MSLGKWLNPSTWRRPRDFESRLAALQPKLQRHRDNAAQARQRGGAELRCLLAEAEYERAQLTKTIADQAPTLGVEWSERHDGLLLRLIEIDARTGQATDTGVLRTDLRSLIEQGLASDAGHAAREALDRAQTERLEAEKARQEERSNAAYQAERDKLIDHMATLAKEMEATGRPDAAAEWERQQEKSLEKLVFMDRTAGRDSDPDTVREEIRRRIADK